MKRSRLRRAYEQRTKKHFVYTIGAIIVILILLIKYGIPAIANFTLVLSGKTSTSDQTQKTDGTDVSFVPAPSLEQSFTATNTAEITITATANKNEKVKLYVNNSLTDTKPTDDNGSVTFTNVPLNKGQNTLKAIAMSSSDKESSASDSITISYFDKPPSLSVDYPTEGQTIKSSSTITVTGKTDSDAKVTVNGFQAIVQDNGSYSYDVNLNNGDNIITVIAQDDAGNQTKIDRKTTYAP